MNNSNLHTFHIPVLGLAYSIDTPLKVARFGISSVVSIIEDELIEQMRKFHCEQNNEVYLPITVNEEDYRARRITAYLDLLDLLVKKQVASLRSLPFEPGSDIVKYFELLPSTAPAGELYERMQKLPAGQEKSVLQEILRKTIVPGTIDVNIMAKVDNLRYDKEGVALPVEYADAMSALRGFANSTLRSSLVFSAGYNPRLFNYIPSFPDFFPDNTGEIKKKITIKVSDYRSALLQGKILAKHGLWVSEFRIESGLNCGGHAFPTDGMLLGPILEEFRKNRGNLTNELFSLCRNNGNYSVRPQQWITVQGGIGTNLEQDFLLDHYGVDRTGWGSPFLLVPETTNVDTDTLGQLATAKPSDYFLSNASPLGVPFNNFRHSSSEAQRKRRIEQGRPGSPCYKKYLSSNTEFTDQPICTASRLYQKLKADQLMNDPDNVKVQNEVSSALEKDCLCEGLVAPALLKNGLKPSHNLTAVTICPGPNLAYFSGTFSLKQMVGHIYGRCNLLNNVPRPNMFVNELYMYVDHLKKQVANAVNMTTPKQVKQLQVFKDNLLSGIDYYSGLLFQMVKWDADYMKKTKQQLTEAYNQVKAIEVQAKAAVI